MTLKQKLESHKRNATCAACHLRIDPLGFPFEKYDPVGRWRTAYADGKPIEDTSTAVDKTEINGIDGLIAYLQKNDEQVRRNMAQKMLGYALGRTIIASDLPLIDQMVKAGPEATVAQLAAEIVKSPQFRNRRGEQLTSPGPKPRTASVARATTTSPSRASSTLRPISTRGDR